MNHDTGYILQLWYENLDYAVRTIDQYESRFEASRHAKTMIGTSTMLEAIEIIDAYSGETFEVWEYQ